MHGLCKKSKTLEDNNEYLGGVIDELQYENNSLQLRVDSLEIQVEDLQGEVDDLESDVFRLESNLDDALLSSEYD